ncbi:hypothetical protein RNJ44_00236 [Nakaseomyces bracarensis]|uniref:Glycerophosphocholine acyltransferase 1 n=1 Tax=Nakaseomyces bracarensis TaxID=273131 RepID=A0ABR4NTB3_9SACH
MSTREWEDEIHESESIWLGNLVELLDPIASKKGYTEFPTLNSYDYRKTWQKAKDKLRDGRGKLISKNKDRLVEKLKKLDGPLNNIFHETSRLEKLFYPFTLFNIFFIGYLMGGFPEYFHIYYTVMFCILIPIRFYTYYKSKSHYFLADLCYFVNVLCLLYIWVFPASRVLFLSCFALTFGSLSFAVITWRNSLVIHMIDKTTSCFIHIIPPCSMFVIYRAITPQYRAIRFPGAMIMDPKGTISLKSNIVNTSLYYLVWQVLYHYFITMRKSSKIEAGERETSFHYLTTHQFKNFWAVKLPAPWPMIIYTFLQYMYQLCTMLLCNIWIKYDQIWSQFFLLSIFLCAAYNGATYYVDYYGKSMQNEVNRLKSQVEALQDELEAYQSENKEE